MGLEQEESFPPGLAMVEREMDVPIPLIFPINFHYGEIKVGAWEVLQAWSWPYLEVVAHILDPLSADHESFGCLCWTQSCAKSKISTSESVSQHHHF